MNSGGHFIGAGLSGTAGHVQHSLIDDGMSFIVIMIFPCARDLTQILLVISQVKRANEMNTYTHANNTSYDDNDDDDDDDTHVIVSLYALSFTRFSYQQLLFLSSTFRNASFRTYDLSNMWHRMVNAM